MTYDDWILMSEDQPHHNQSVWYFFEYTGVNHGKYDEEYNCFYGKRGFLCGDVTHWMPHSTGDEYPQAPDIS